MAIASVLARNAAANRSSELRSFCSACLRSLMSAAITINVRAADFRNVRLAERADADFAHLVVRLLLFATWRLALLDRLSASRDPVLAAIGAKGVKEVTYHREYAAQWVVRLGDGTDVSHRRTQDAVDAVTSSDE